MTCVKVLEVIVCNCDCSMKEVSEAPNLVWSGQGSSSVILSFLLCSSPCVTHTREGFLVFNFIDVSILEKGF